MKQSAIRTTDKPSFINDVWQKIKAFFARNSVCFYAMGIACFLYLIGLALNGVFPFGNRYTAASYDLSAQICPFIEHIFDVFSGKSSLSYSYAIAGGADVTGTFLYFFISPFSWVFLILGDGLVAEASSIVMALKIPTIAFMGTWFAKKLFDGIPDYICVCVGIVYAYCGYMFVANTYINWLDFLIYLPVCVYAFRHFVKTGSFWQFAVTLALCIYTCFSIASFSLFTVFPLLVGYGLLCVSKRERKTFIARLCWAFFMAILLALPVLFPALVAYMRSARGGDLFENIWKGVVFKDSAIGGVIDRFSTNSSGNVYELNLQTALYAKFSYILTDSVFVALTLVWLMQSNWKQPFVKFMLLAGGLTMLPVVVDEVMLLMNMGSYMSYALRFGFLNAVYFLGGACLCLEKVCYRFRYAYDGTLLASVRLYTGEKVILTDAQTRSFPNAKSRAVSPSIWWGVLMIALGVSGIAFIGWYTLDDKYKEVWTEILSSSDLVDGLKYFSSRFAHSLGGLEVVGFICIAVMVIVFVGVWLVRTKKISAKLLSFVLIAVVGVQVVFYNNELVIGNSSTQHIDLTTYERLCETLNGQDLSYFRVKDYGDKLTANAPFKGNSNAYSVFSSVIDKDNFVAGELFGYDGNLKNSLKGEHNPKKYNRGDEFGDAVMGYKYFFVHNDAKAKMTAGELAKYMKPALDGEGNPIAQDGYHIYENTLVFPTAYRIESGEFRFVQPNVSNSTYRAENQRALFEFLCGESLADVSKKVNSSTTKYVKPESVKYVQEYLQRRSASSVEVGAGKITVHITAEKDGEALFMSFIASKGYTAYVNGNKAPLIDNDLKFLSVALEQGENVVEFVYTSPYGGYALLGLLCGTVGILAMVLVFKKTKWTEVLAPVIYWLAIALTVAVVAFFMIYPTAIAIVKLVYYLIL